MAMARITGVGHHAPERIVTNHDLTKLMDTSDEWIRERTGIEERHFVSEHEQNSDLAEKASRMALERAGKSTEDIEFIVFATLSPEYYFPGSGVLLQEKLGIPGIGALDIRTQCTGFVYGLSIAEMYVKNGMYKTVLVVGSEVQSRGMDITTKGRDVSVIFGDGAGAAVVEAYDGPGEKGILNTKLHADGRHATELWCEDPGSMKSPRITKAMIDEDVSIWPYMNGRNVFKHAVSKFPKVIAESLESAGVEKNDLDLVIPHQANMRITEAVRSRLDLPTEKVFSNIQKYGNTTAASIPIAMSEAWEQGLIKEDNLVCLAAFGSGFTWASALIRW